MNYLPGVGLEPDPPDFCFLSSWITGVSHQHLAPVSCYKQHHDEYPCVIFVLVMSLFAEAKIRKG
jgi:hypothetical protein